jgi:hypothetical protein
MQNKEIAELLDQERWLLNHGLLTDSAKNQLFFCGSIVHKDVQAVELELAPDKKMVAYKVYLPKTLINKVNKYNALSTKKDLISLWRFKRIIKKEGNLNFHGILSKFVKDFCGAKWTVTVEILDFDKFSSNGDGGGDDSDGWSLDQSSDKR